MRISGPRMKALDARNRAIDEARFFRRWLTRPLVTGAVSPSSRALGRAMAAFVPQDAAGAGEVPLAVLELGPGTGVVTQCLIDRGVPEENLVLVEYSTEFCVLLRARFPRAAVVEGDAYAAGTNPRACLAGASGSSAADIDRAIAGRAIGAVVSSLPLFTKPDAMREKVIGEALARMGPGRPFIQFSYALTLPVKPAKLGASVEKSEWIKRNLPPARVLVYRRP